LRTIAGNAPKRVSLGSLLLAIGHGRARARGHFQQSSSLAPNETTPIAYLSTSRALALYQNQKQLMERLQIPILNVYDASYLAAHQTKPGDARHFTRKWNQMAIDWFYKDGTETKEKFRD
jgi:hypothetical protein